MDRRSWVAIKADALVRWIMWRTLSGRLPLYLVTEYPKSGGTWFSQMLAECLGVPYPQNRMPGLGRCVMHGHHLYHPSFRNVFCVVRDGRDALCSAYFHVLFDHGLNRLLVKKFRQSVPFRDYERVRENMPAFIEFMFTARDRGPFKFTWSEFVRSWVGKGVEVVKYEDLLADAPATLGRAVRKVLGVEVNAERLQEVHRKYRFENVARRKPGQEDTGSFLRKGVAGDWREKFSREACQVFDRFAGEELILMGYEPDHTWVERPQELRG